MAGTNDGFERTATGWFVLLDGSLALLALLVLLPSVAARLRSSAPLPSDRALRLILVGALVAHLSEGLAAWIIASKAELPAAKWAAQTTLVGFPSLTALRRLAA